MTIAGCESCKDKQCNDWTNPECPNYIQPIDPCINTHPVTADFIISQWAGPGANNMYVETQYHLLAESLVKLTAIEDGASYKWIIGEDTIYSREYEFTFSNNFQGQIIPLTLIVFKSPDHNCWPEDDGIDTLVRIVHIRPTCTLSLLGLYHGSWEESPQDSFYISFRATDSDIWPGEDCNALVGRGLNGDFNDSCQVEIGGNTDNFVQISGNYCSYLVMGDPWGEFYIYPEENRIYADYYFSIDVDGSPVQIFK